MVLSAMDNIIFTLFAGAWRKANHSGDKYMRSRVATAFILATALLCALPKASPLALEGDYEIIKATENVAWRLNKKTGEISACRFTGDAMTCASSNTAVIRPKTSLEDLKNEQKRERAERQEEEMAMLERLFAYFKMLISTVKEMEPDFKPKDKAKDLEAPPKLN